MSKKVLSLALVVVMLMSMFAFSTSAALATGQVGIKVVSDAVVGAPAGTEVTVSLYLEAPEGEDVQMTLSTFSLGYNSAAYEVVSGSLEWGASYDGMFQNTNTTVSTAAALVNKIVGLFNAEDTANGWDTGLQVKQGYVSGGPATTKTGYAIDSDCVLFTLKFKALKALEAKDVIGVVKGAYGQNVFTVKGFTTATTAGVAYDVANVDVTNAVAAPAAAKAPVYWVANQVRPNGDAMDIGIKAGFNTADIDIAFDANGTSTNVMTVGAKLKVNGADAGTGTSRFVYKISDTEYQYRVILEGIAKDSTDVYTVELFVEVKDEATGKTTIIPGDTVTVKAADVVGKLPA